MKRTNIIAGILCAMSLVMFYDCANFLNEKVGYTDKLADNTENDWTDSPNADDDQYDETDIPSVPEVTNSYAKVFNVTSNDSLYPYNFHDIYYDVHDVPNWNTFFPPKLNSDFLLYKIFENGTIDYKGGRSYQSYISADYEDSFAWAYIDNYYIDKDDYLYLAPDDDSDYAYLFADTVGNPIVDSCFHPDDLITIECNEFGYYAYSYDEDDYYWDYYWDISFSEEPDALYFVADSNYDIVVSKEFWKLSNYFNDHGFSEYVELERSEKEYCTDVMSYNYVVWGYYAAIFAKYGDYYVRVTPVLKRQ